MSDELEEAEAIVLILVHTELEVHHRLAGHPVAVRGCPVCASHSVGDHTGQASSA